MNRKNLIDGLPNSYNVSYVIQTEKSCILCNEFITESEIFENNIICTEELNFYHKKCLLENNITYKHYNPKDKSTPIIIEKQNIENHEK